MKFDWPQCTQNFEIADEWSGHSVDWPTCQIPPTVPGLTGLIASAQTASKPPATSQPAKLRRPAAGSGAPPKPQRQSGGEGLGKFLLILLVLAGAEFGYAMEVIDPAISQAIPTPAAAQFPTPRFAHPGVILTREDLEILKANIKREPWKSGFEALANDGHSKLTYKMAGPFKEIKRAPHENLWPWRNDMVAIWNLSRMWYFTGDTAYAQKAHDILLAWAKTQTSFGGRESMLDLGDYAAAFVGGADILRGTWPGWTSADTAAVKKYFNDVLIPASNPYGESQFGAANKGALALCAKGLMAIFNEDTAAVYL